MITLLPGDIAPDFSLPDAAGKAHSLADFPDSRLLLYFYPEDDTELCTQQACSIRDNWTAILAAGCQVYGISRDSIASHAAFAAKYSLPFTLLADEEKKVHLLYGTWGEKLKYGKMIIAATRASFLLDRVSNGTSGRLVLKVWKQARTAKHGDDVLRELGKLKQ